MKVRVEVPKFNICWEVSGPDDIEALEVAAETLDLFADKLRQVLVDYAEALGVVKKEPRI